MSFKQTRRKNLVILRRRSAESHGLEWVLKLFPVNRKPFSQYFCCSPLEPQITASSFLFIENLRLQVKLALRLTTKMPFVSLPWKHQPNKINMKKIAAILLLILGFYMIYLGFLPEKVMHPPVVSGLGFIIIGVVFLSPKS